MDNLQSVIKSQGAFPNARLALPPMGGFGRGGEGEDQSMSSKSPVPSLDFRKMKVVKETDWYTQTKKLEEVTNQLREQVKKLEKSLDDAHDQTS